MNDATPIADRIWITDAVKAEPSSDGSLRLRILGGPHGLDRQGQVFDSQTDFGRSKQVGLVYYHGFADADTAPSVTYLGEATKAERDERGQWFIGTLDDTPLGQRIYNDAVAGKARASSDAMPHLVRPRGIVGRPGRVSSWPIGAISLMDSTTAHQAINPGAVVSAVKAYYDELTKQLELNDSGESVKAGAVFARRNRERLQQLRALIDELQSEMPDEFQPETPSEQESNQNAQPEAANVANPVAHGATKAMEEKELLSKVESIVDQRFTAAAKAAEDERKAAEEAASERGKQEAAIKAQVDAQLADKLKELDEAAVKAGRPRFFAGASATKAEEDAAKAERAAFENYYRFGQREWTDMPAAKAAMNEGTPSQGGYLVPTLYNNEIVRAITEGSILRLAGSRVLSIQGTNAFKTPSLTYTVAAVLTSEAGTFDPNEPTLGEVTHVPYKYTRLSKASDELLADSRVDVFGQVLGPDAANAFVLAENAAFTTGTGASQPQGVVTGSSLGVTAASATAIAPDELIDLFHSVSYVYRPRAVWMMNDATIKAVRKLKEATTNQYLWQPGLQAGQPDTLLGRPVITNNNMATIATGNKTVLFGDLTYFWIVDFSTLEFRRLDELYAANGQVGFRWFKRMDSHVMLSAAIKHLIQA